MSASASIHCLLIVEYTVAIKFLQERKHFEVRTQNLASSLDRHTAAGLVNIFKHQQLQSCWFKHLPVSTVDFHCNICRVSVHELIVVKQCFARSGASHTKHQSLI